MRTSKDIRIHHTRTQHHSTGPHTNHDESVMQATNCVSDRHTSTSLPNSMRMMFGLSKSNHQKETRLQVCTVAACHLTVYVGLDPHAPSQGVPFKQTLLNRVLHTVVGFRLVKAPAVLKMVAGCPLQTSFQYRHLLKTHGMTYTSKIIQTSLRSISNPAVVTQTQNPCPLSSESSMRTSQEAQCAVR